MFVWDLNVDIMWQEMLLAFVIWKGNYFVERGVLTRVLVISMEGGLFSPQANVSADCNWKANIFK